MVPRMEMTDFGITRVEKKELLRKSQRDIEREKEVENIVHFIHGHSSTTFLFLTNYNVPYDVNTITEHNNDNNRLYNIIWVGLNLINS